MHRALDLAEQAGQHRIGLGLAAEEGDLDAIGQILVDQHADMLAFLQRLCEAERRVASGRDQRSHLYLPHLLDDAVGGGDVGPAIQQRGIDAMGDGGERRHFPIAEMGGEDQRRLAVEPELVKQLVGAAGYVDVAELGLFLDVVPDVVDMRELGRAAAEILPDAVQDRLDLLGRFLGECGHEIGAADLVFAQARPDGAGDALRKSSTFSCDRNSGWCAACRRSARRPRPRRATSWCRECVS